MTQLFQQIESLIPKLHGWATVEKAITLASAVIALRPEIVLEVGVWGGRSLFPLALACKAVGKGKVIGVDPWVSVAAIQGQTEANRKWWNEQPFDMVYNDFMQRRTQLGLSDVTVIERMISDYFTPPKQIGICHLDGNHGPQAFVDAQRFAPLVQVGGFLALDDLEWEGNHVRRAFDYARSIGFVELFKCDTGVMMQRISQ